MRPDIEEKTPAFPNQPSANRLRFRKAPNGLIERACIFAFALSAAKFGAARAVEAYQDPNSFEVRSALVEQIGIWPPSSPAIEDGIPERIIDIRQELQDENLKAGAGGLGTAVLLTLGVSATIYRKHDASNYAEEPSDSSEFLPQDPMS